MSYGTAFSSTRPTPAVTVSPTYETMLEAWMAEAEGKLEAKITATDTDFSAVADVPHGTRTIEIPAAGGTALVATYNAAFYWVSGGGTDTVQFPIPVQIGQRIRGVSMHGRADGAAAWTLEVFRINKATGASTSLGSIASAVAAAIEEKAIAAITETVTADLAYVARWTAGGTGSRCYGATFQVDRV